MLIQRILTAVILAPSAIGAILYLPPFVTTLLFVVFLSIATWEWTKLARLPVNSSIVTVLLFLVLAGVIWWKLPARTIILPSLIGTSMLWSLIALFVVYSQTTGKKDLSSRLGRWLRGPVSCLVLLSGALIGAVCLLLEDPILLLLIFVAVWSADIGAYFVGKRWGRRKLAANISPGKSWEGAFGGVALSGLSVLLASHWIILSHNQRIALICLGILAACLSIFGDLFESLLKRSGGFKDSGNILPGHGGVLDRIDGLIAAIPIYSLGVFLWVNKL